MIDTTIDARQALAGLTDLRNNVKKATYRALNKAAAQAKTQASREIRTAGYNLKAGEIKKGITVSKATTNSLTASVIATGKPVPLYQYGPVRKVANGVMVTVKNGRKLIRGAFIARMPGGHIGIYERDLRGGGKKGYRRVKYVKGGKPNNKALPIREKFGPSIAAAFISPPVHTAIVSTIDQKFPALLEHELDYLNSRTGGS